MTKVEKIDYITQRPISKKDRRHNGWVYPNSTLRCPKQYIIDNCLEPEPYWNDWGEYRDGFRDWRGDWKKIKKVESSLCHYPDEDLTEREEVLLKLLGIEKFIDDTCIKRRQMNIKQRRLLKIRKAMKSSLYKHCEL